MLIIDKIMASKTNGQKMLAILIDPDKVDIEVIAFISQKINASPATHLFVGGSEVFSTKIDDLILELKKYCSLPILLFPGNPSQISVYADGILFLNLISGRNPDFLIEFQVKAAPFLKKTNLEIIPTAYMLIESGRITAVERISKTKPMSTKNIDFVIHTAQAGELMGNKLVYLEAGSGAKNSVPIEMVKKVAQHINIPLIVGGGISNIQDIQKMFDAGADIVVIGTAFEKNNHFFES